MLGFGKPWPWLDKAEAIRQSIRLIGDSAVAARGLLGYFDEAEETPFWHPPRSEGELGAARPELHVPERQAIPSRAASGT